MTQFHFPNLFDRECLALETVSLIPVKKQERPKEINTAKWGRIRLCVLLAAISPLVLNADNTELDHEPVMPPFPVENQNVNFPGVSPESVVVIRRLTFHRGKTIDGK